MKLNADFYFQLEASASPLYQAMGKVAQEQDEQPVRHPLLQVQNGRAESPAWFLVQAAEFDPEPLTVARLRVRDIYASESIVQAILEMLAAEQWLERRGDSYHLTEAGRTEMDALLGRAPSLLRQADVPSHVNLDRLETLLGCVIDASLSCDDPPGSWCLLHSRNRAPQVNEPAAVLLLQYFSDFNAFRDDAHMAAWRPTGVAGYEWEAFAFVMSNQANTATALYEQLFYRGYSQTDYGDALNNLVARGWLAEGEEQVSVTAEGQSVHTNVEALTDEYFYGPWTTALSDSEMAEVVELLRVLREEWE